MDGAEPGLPPEAIAVIGMAARLPGAEDVDAFWRNLVAGTSAIRRADDAALRAAGFSDAELADPALVRAFGVLDDAFCFDARFFGFPPARAAALDPQQRLLLELAWHALEHAGYGPGTFADSVGTYFSIAQSQYRAAGADDVADGFFALTSRDKDYAASRVAYKLDLTGPSMMIQAASSGALAAVHAAVEGLLSGQCDMALAGGCSIALPQGAYRHAPGLMLSPSGACRSFDAEADGTVPGSGAGIVVLKPLARAIEDGDTVYAVIRGSALNNDGAQKTDYLAPSVRGQARVIGEALAAAGVEPESVGYIETHGTGTAIGDPIEVRALAQVFRREAFGERRCALGALKPSIGHLHVASGIAGLIKAALAVHHGRLPPTLNFARAHAETALDETPFFVNDRLAGWPFAGPRRAGVSAFGLGGTNVHVVLEEAPEPAPRPAFAEPVVLVLSARTRAALDALTAALARHLRAAPEQRLADVGFTLAVGRQRFAERRVVFCADRAGAIAALEAGTDGGLAEAGGAMAEAGRRWLVGEPVAWNALFATASPRRVALPLYPFEKVEHRAEAAAEAPALPADQASRPVAPDTLLARVQAVVAARLGQQGTDLDPDLTYEHFGIDSLLVNSITADLQRDFPKLRPTALFQHTTLRRLAAHLAELDPAAAAGPAPSAAPAASEDGIAVIGVAGRYPGAKDVDAFWENLRAGRESIREVPEARWDWRAHVDAGRKDRAYTRWGGFIEDVDCFDALFFGISPREAKLLDPQQRLFIETAWHAMEDAGYTRQGLKAAARRACGGDVGVFAGAMHQAYRLLGMEAVQSGLLVQANHWSIANRVSYLFDFTGPSLTVDTACSASLAAIHLACESLRRGECGVAIAGGVNLVLHPQQPLELSRAGMLSKGPHNSAFGAAGDGFVQGEGVGAVVLKPLAAALADGDRVLAIIRGSAMNAGGKTSGYTVPNPNAQAELVATALRRAGLAAEQVGYVECHGTGTSLGDPIEIAGLADAFRAVGRAPVPCAIGSVKTNIGHLEAAAGIAGFTKTVLQLAHAELVPSLHAEPPNPRIDFAAGPFAVQRGTSPWPAPAYGRRAAGVSSFGAGGANIHVVLEEAPAVEPREAMTGSFLVPLSARDPERLRALAARLSSWLARTDAALADIAFTLATGREAMECRAAFVVSDTAELRRALGTIEPAGASAAADATAVERALAARDLPALARLWCAGAAIDWAPLFTGESRRRVGLPGYPFARERHWLPEIAPAPVAPATHPLLGAPLPTLAAEAVWGVSLSAQDTLLADHVVENVPTLPGVASIELAVAAARALGRALPLRICDVAWLRRVTPIDEAVDARLVLRGAGERIGFSLECGDVACARGRIEAGTSAPAALAPLAGGRIVSAAELYASLERRGIVYGPTFRTIREVRVDGTEAEAVAVAGEGFGGCILHPGLLDAALQTTAALLGDGPLLLPFAVGAVDIFRAPPANCRLRARLIEPPADGVARFDVTIADADGAACVTLRDLAGRIASAEPAIPPCYEPVWIEAPAAPVPASADLAVLSVEDDAARAALTAALPGVAMLPAPRGREGWAGLIGASRRVVFVCPATSGAEAPRQMLHLCQALAASPDPAAVTVLATGALAALPGDSANPWAAAAFGVARTAAHERPDWSVRCLDVAEWRDAPAALTDPGDARGREIAWRGGRRLARVLRQFTPEARRPAFRTGGTYVILGGAGGIGMALAGHLASRYRARVALIGRTEPAPERLAALSAAGGVAFFRADATDGAALRAALAAVRARFGDIHGAIHSAIVMQDQAFATMQDAAFDAAFDVKSLGTLNLIEALAEGARPDWLALFSSANSFAANAGQANYVAGCLFKDACAPLAARRLGCDVHVINWGFWGEVGRVADPAYRALLARRGVQPIGTAEGIAAIEALLAAGTPQALVLRAEARVLADLGAEMAATDEAVALAEYDALDVLARRMVAAWARGAGIGIGGSVAERAARFGVTARHARVFAALCEMLDRAEPGAPDETGFLAAHPDLAPHVALLRTCIAAFDEVLRDRATATSVMFPNASMSLVEGIYRGSRLTDLCNAMVADAVRDAALARPAGRLRVIEVGAGTGGTAAGVLEALAATGREIDYVYTDVSPAFLQHGERRFAARYPFLRFALLDLGRPIETQNFAAGDFDIVIGANVVHVVAALRPVAEGLRALLRPGGALVLYEMTALPDFVTATFGLLDGWWAFTDARLPHGPLLDAPGWARVLREAGFASVTLRGLGGPDPAALRHGVIVATQAADTVAPVLVEPPVAAEEPEAEEDDLAGTIATIVAETLQMRRADLRSDRNFSDYGADSIISVDLIAALNARLGITLKPTILFSHPTIERLTAHVREHHGAAAPARRPRRAARLAARATGVAAPEPVPAPMPALLPAPLPATAPRRSAWADDIAIIGAAGRFPGAGDLAAFWRNIEAGIDSVGPVPRARWDQPAIYDPAPGLPGRTDCPAGGFLGDVEHFDPLFFNLSPNEATAMDPQQRLFLEESWHALEDAGYAGPHPAHARCGVFVGCVAGDYDTRLREAGRAPDAQLFMGNAASMLAARIAYKLDLRGPCLSVDTACSSSLVAVQLACESLLRGESDLALAGGVAVMTRPDFYVAAASAGMLSPSGRCRTLDAAADGFVPAEGVGAVVLKRRADALRDGDRILALIVGAASNQDGASNGITAPNGTAQTALERLAHERFGVDPATLGYVELHGTGTKLGDPIEIDALTAAFAGSGAAPGGCAIGSVKANIGHALAAAGVAGVIKLALMLCNDVIPPAVNFERPNAHLDLSGGPFRIPRAAERWAASGGARRGAVSSFGFSGTNVHLLMQEAPPAPVRARPVRPVQLAVLSAQSPAALERLRAALGGWLAGAGREADLADICGTLARGRGHFRHRAAFVARDLAELRAALDAPAAAGGPLTEPEAALAAASRGEAAGCQALAAHYLAGADIRWERLHPDGSFARLALPLYPFERRRCWPEEAPPPRPARPADSVLALFDSVIAGLDLPGNAGADT
jgi:acyl transferase domain-containing protein/acyl carrier protein/SAM-dependent methyltransferase